MGIEHRHITDGLGLLRVSTHFVMVICPTTLLPGTHGKHRPGLVSREHCGGLGFQGSLSNVVGLALVSTC